MGGGSGGSACDISEVDCAGSTTGEMFAAYGGGGGGETGVTTGIRDRVKEFEWEGRWFFNTESARAKMELFVGCGVCCVEFGARMNCVICMGGGVGLREDT